MNFADRLNARMDRVNSRLVIGIDPDPERLFGENSPFIQAFSTEDVEIVLEGFCDLLLSVAKDNACAVKPQSAFFESLGIKGLKVLSRCIKKGRSMDIPVIIDVKRGDIGNTAKAYSFSYLGPSSDFSADAMTVNPYLGPDTLIPFVEGCKEWGKGLFVLVKTSNPGSGAFQDKEFKEGKTLFQEVADSLRVPGEDLIGESGYSSLGAVVGATYPSQLQELRRALPHSLFLVPGYGAQGGTAQDIKGAFDSAGKGAVISSSRTINYAYKPTAEMRAKPEMIFEEMKKAAVKANLDLQGALSTPST